MAITVSGLANPTFACISPLSISMNNFFLVIDKIDNTPKMAIIQVNARMSNQYPKTANANKPTTSIRLDPYCGFNLYVFPSFIKCFKFIGSKFQTITNRRRSPIVREKADKCDLSNKDKFAFKHFSNNRQWFLDFIARIDDTNNDQQPNCETDVSQER